MGEEVKGDVRGGKRLLARFLRCGCFGGGGGVLLVFKERASRFGYCTGVEKGSQEDFAAVDLPRRHDETTMVFLPQRHRGHRDDDGNHEGATGRRGGKKLLRFGRIEVGGRTEGKYVTSTCWSQLAVDGLWRLKPVCWLLVLRKFHFYVAEVGVAVGGGGDLFDGDFAFVGAHEDLDVEGAADG